MKAQMVLFDRPSVDAIPETGGVVQLLDEQQQVIYIAGVPNLRRALAEQLGSNKTARFFQTEETFMYTMRESELLRIYLRRHGHLPEGNTLPDDLYD